MNSFTRYKPRNVEFRQLLTSNDWTIKLYTITHRASFGAETVLANALAQLPTWLEKSKALKFPTYNIAFLIVHEGRDGVWTLINWWIGGEMLQATTFYTSFEKPGEFLLLPTEGFMACVWELAVISFERAMWVEYILKKAEKPDFTGYLQKYRLGLMSFLPWLTWIRFGVWTAIGIAVYLGYGLKHSKLADTSS